MRISDWSSDVCSSDLDRAHVTRGALAAQAPFDEGAGQLAVGDAVAIVEEQHAFAERELFTAAAQMVADQPGELLLARLVGQEQGVDEPVLVRAREGIVRNSRSQSGRASCRERVGQYV